MCIAAAFLDGTKEIERKLANRLAAQTFQERKEETVVHLEGLVMLWKWRADSRRLSPSSPSSALDLRDGLHAVIKGGESTSAILGL